MLPCWNSEKCITCNQCVMACPHAVIRPKLMTQEELDANPGIKYLDVKGTDMKFALEISYDDCTGCGVCTSVCPSNALTMGDKDIERFNNKIEGVKNKHLYPETIVKGLAFNKPLFKYNSKCYRLFIYIWWFYA